VILQGNCALADTQHKLKPFTTTSCLGIQDEEQSQKYFSPSLKPEGGVQSSALTRWRDWICAE